MKLVKASWNSDGNPYRILVEFEMSSREEVKRMQQFVEAMEREVDGIPIDKEAELRAEYAENESYLCEHGMNPVTCFEAWCRMNPAQAQRKGQFLRDEKRKLLELKALEEDDAKKRRDEDRDKYLQSLVAEKQKRGW